MNGKNGFGLAVFAAVFALLLPSAGLAIQSPNYQIDEDFIGGSGSPESSSGSYRAQDSAGATAVGDSVGTAFKSQSGATTTNDPSLTFAINTSSVSLGDLSVSLTRTGTASFSVLNYTSYGYVVQVLGNPPSSGAHTLAAMASPAASSAGTEQFGINLVANTSPTTFGDDPVQVPDPSFSFGTAASGYDTANTYKYISGNTIAQSSESSGQTDYTISYIANIASATPAGSYSGNQVLVCTGTY